MVSFIQSNYTTFGAGVAVPGRASRSNRGANFSLDPASDNCLAGGKEVLPHHHSRLPAQGRRRRRPIRCDGAAFMQPQGQTEVLVNTLDYHMNPQEALDAPRIQWIGGRRLELEREAGEAIADELRAMGHEVTVVDDRISMGPRSDHLARRGRRLHGGHRAALRRRGRRVVKEVAADNNKEGAAFPVQGARRFFACLRLETRAEAVSQRLACSIRSMSTRMPCR